MLLCFRRRHHLRLVVAEDAADHFAGVSIARHDRGHVDRVAATIKPEVVEREAERRGVEPEAARVVESVAVAIPAGATEVDASRELLRALEASRIEWRRAYDDLLTWYVGVLREIAARRQAQLDDDNAAILLLLMEH